MKKTTYLSLAQSILGANGSGILALAIPAAFPKLAKKGEAFPLHQG